MRLGPLTCRVPEAGQGALWVGEDPATRGSKGPRRRAQMLSAVPRPRDLGQRTGLIYNVGVVVMVPAPSGGEEEIRWCVPSADESTAWAPEWGNAAPLSRGQGVSISGRQRFWSVAPPADPRPPCPLCVAGGGGGE